MAGMKSITFLSVLLAFAAASAGAFVVRPSGRFMAIPVENGAPKLFLEVFDGGRRVAYDQIEWAINSTNWIASLDLSGYGNKPLEFRFSSKDRVLPGENDLVFSDRRFVPAEGQFDEAWRPQLNFTPATGWNNDPNGLSYRNGEWHLFYQSNPFGIGWGNMHWGHAVSKDLVHWEDVGYALAPDRFGTMFSGSAVTDHENTAGFGKGAHVLVYTARSTPPVQCIAWSIDGRTYEKFPNAVLGARTDALRDPKVCWYAKGRCWVMAVYGEVEKKRHGVSLFTSGNLKDWEFAGHIPGDWNAKGTYLFECPDFFEMQIEGEKETRWVLVGADGRYAIGNFDGRAFAAETSRLSLWHIASHGYPVYAPQTFDGAPDGRRIQIVWSRFDTKKTGDGKTMFNQGMTLPSELKLVRTAEGLRLARFPVKELECLRVGDAVDFSRFDGELAEVVFSCKPPRGTAVSLDLRGIEVVFDPEKNSLSAGGRSVLWKADAEGRFGLHAFVDRAGLELYSLDGLWYMPVPSATPDPRNRKLSWSTQCEADAKAWLLESALKRAK